MSQNFLKEQHGNIRREQRLGHFSLLVSMVLMGTAYVGAKLALQGTGPFTTAFLRFLITVLISWPILILIKGLQPIRKEHIVPLIGHALFQTTFYFALQYEGLRYTTASNTALIVNTRPIILAIFAVIFFKEEFTILQWLALLISFGGVMIIIYNPGPATLPNHLWGDFLILLNALSGALGIVFAKRLLDQYQPFTLLVYQITIGIVGLLPLALFETHGQLPSISQIEWGPIIFLAVFCTAVAQGLLNFGLARLPVSITGAYFFIIPILNVIFAYYFLAEPITWSLVFGGILIIAGTYFVNRNKAPTAEKKIAVETVNLS